MVQLAPAHAESGNDLQQLIKQRTNSSAGSSPSADPVVFAPSASEQFTPDQTGVSSGPSSAEVASVKVGGEPMIAPGSANELRAAETRYANIVAQGGWPKVGRGTFRKGSTGKNVAALNRRLALEGYLNAAALNSDAFTPATAQALARFQANMGLDPTGKMDGPTLNALNVPAANRVAAIRANIDRLAAYEQDLGSRYIVVNVPAQQIETVSNGSINSIHRAIVGKPERPTPVVMTALSDINFNPYWNAPVSIVERDIIPKILNGGTDILRSMNIRVFKGYGSEEIDPDKVDWRTAVPDEYLFRQDPGGENAMATAKINFSSPFGIYLHDTPERYAFNNSGRFYSSGCVRVDKVAVLLNWVLNGQDGFNPARIAELAKSQERLDVKLANPPQLRVAYLTAWPGGGGTVAFRDDIYQLDGTGFTVGQPMPVGEKSPDGQRFVLKPIPRQPSSVDAAEAEGFGLFGLGSKSKSGTKQASATDKKAAKTDASAVTATSKPPLKPAAGETAKTTTATTADKTTTATTAEKKVATTAEKKATAKKTHPGLFDWSQYRKEQANTAKAPVKPTAKKDVAKKDAAKKDAAKADTAKKNAAKKPADQSAASKATADKTATGKKPADAKKAVKKPVPPAEKTASSQ